MMFEPSITETMGQTRGAQKVTKEARSSKVPWAIPTTTVQNVSEPKVCSRDLNLAGQ